MKAFTQTQLFCFLEIQAREDWEQAKWNVYIEYEGHIKKYYEEKERVAYNNINRYYNS